MRVFILLVVSGLLALCTGGAHAETGGNPLQFVRTPTGYVVVWDESKSHFTVDLQGQHIRPSDIGGYAFFLDENVYQFLSVDPASFAAGEVSAHAILDRYMQYEVGHWHETIGMELPSVVHAREDSPERSFILWEIQWTEQARQKAKAKATKQLFLSAIAGDRVVVVSRTVVEGEDAAAALSDFSAVARSLVIKDAPIDVKAIQDKIRGHQ
ncbi:MAG TPA: hypothetical protein VOA87_13465 [Thermoanaerobaculia bacterium]|nr:hypothetical protein [Thermoanaerobaculia bacterium]